MEDQREKELPRVVTLMQSAYRGYKVGNFLENS